MRKKGKTKCSFCTEPFVATLRTSANSANRFCKYHWKCYQEKDIRHEIKLIKASEL